jgi:hypothetical protein
MTRSSAVRSSFQERLARLRFTIAISISDNHDAKEHAHQTILWRPVQSASLKKNKKKIIMNEWKQLPYLLCNDLFWPFEKIQPRYGEPIRICLHPCMSFTNYGYEYFFCMEDKVTS